jgi:hypothetical protein
LKTVTLGKKKKKQKKNFNKKTDATWKTKKEKHYLAEKKGETSPKHILSTEKKKKIQEQIFLHLKILGSK